MKCMFFGVYLKCFKIVPSQEADYLESFQPDYITSTASVSKRYNGYIAKFSTQNLGTSDFSTTDGITIYPNPVTDNLIINSKESLKHVSLFDITGKLLIQKQLNGLKGQVSMGHYANGYYLLSIETNSGKLYNKKIIKK
ncbi:T9SS type A sorting domain-containing protein [Bizionia sp.]|uniref:T9SS type A sorting domain-containing protein n=1 Tax=Bizionia sp. TaxID=1954480 RepID=UPI003A8ED9CA